MYGTLTYRQPQEAGGPRGLWLLTAQPHVMMRVKRIFPRVNAHRDGYVALTDTPDVARDLDWLLDRWPLDVDVDARARLDGQVKVQRQSEEAIARVLTGEHQPLPLRDPAREPRRYQLEAADLTLTTGRLLLTDELGLGKTFTSLLTLRAEDALPALVVTLTHLPSQWVEELRRSLPWLTAHILSSSQPYDVAARCGGREPDVLITNYHKLAGWSDHLAGHIRTVIFDEAQELRRAGSGKYTAAAHIAGQARYRMGLTATPVFNYGGEIFNIVDVLAPDELGSHDEFTREWCSSGVHGRTDTKVRVGNPAALGSYLRSTGLMLRRTRHDVGRELPDVVRVPHTIDADEDKLQQLAGDAIERLAEQIVTNTGTREELFTARGDLDWRLRRATGVAKAPYVAQFVKMLLESGEQVVLYGWHRDVYEIWIDQLAGYFPALYTGSESPRQKELAARAFLDGDSRVLVMSLRAGAGLDGLQEVAHVAVFGELDWSPAQHDQCIGRLQRDGQDEPVVAYFLVADSGSDPTIAETLNLKRSQAEPLQTPDGTLLQQTVETDRVRRLAAQFLARRTAKEST